MPRNHDLGGELVTLDILDKYPKLKEILEKLKNQGGTDILTSEEIEYLTGIYDGRNLALENDEQEILAEFRPVFEKIELKKQSNSVEELIKQGKILFDARLLNPISYYDVPLDNKEKLFIEKGTLNEKELNYLKMHEEHVRGIEKLELERKKTDEERQKDIEKVLLKLEEAKIIPTLKNYVNRYGIDRTSNEFENLNSILKEAGFNFDPLELNSILFHIKDDLEYDVFVHRMTSNNPRQLDDFITNFLRICGEFPLENLPYLRKLLVEREIQFENLNEKITEIRKKLELEQFKSTLAITGDLVSVEDCDKMDGNSFEGFLGILFNKMGYKVTRTKNSGDQGADLIIEKLGRRDVVQSKKSQNKITNKAVQEIGTAIKHYDSDGGIVVTNNFFHNSACELAKSNDIELIDRDRLEELLRRYPIEKSSIDTGFLIDKEESDESGLPLLIDELFIKTLKDLEGSEKKPVQERLLIKNLMKTKRFTENSARDMISMMEYELKIYESVENHYNVMTAEVKKKLENEQKRQSTEVSLLQLFFNVIRSLEGENKKPVEEKLLVTELIKTSRFTEEGARNLIRRMLREASIYESVPGYYNGV
ncbi:MAG: restriction endonuclease [Thermoproteota archaeon]